MNKTCEYFQMLVSGFVDGELEEAEREGLQSHLNGCEACRGELEKVRRLVSAASSLRPDDLPEETWNAFIENVYNRLERKTGWTVLIIGLGVLTAFAGYEFAAAPWGSASMKTLIAMPVVGLSILFESVLRERLTAAKHDRYSREVAR